MALKILHISDIHGNIEPLSLVGNVVTNVDLIAVSGDIEDHRALDLLAKYGKPIFAVLGNMDPLSIRSRVRQYLIEGRVVDLGEIYLVGYPISINEVGNIGYKSIILSHYPPYNTRVDIAWSGSHIGSRELRRIVEEAKPLAVLCGHVHEARGVDKLGNTLIVNVGPFYEGYYAIVTVDNGKVNAELGKL
ncbi:MAG: metallophosphoesterase family protein [Vulcanisaeta sp.]